jgi:pyruvate/2-oxoglutarate dehydrogenase complex dihydrolipoamide dehydrogenase (E3) component
MAETQHVDVLVFGSGEAGKYVAWTMAKAVVERKLIGGSCPEHRLPAEQEHHPQRKGR